MKTFSCTCGNTLYFDNTLCLKCGSTLGFDPVDLKIIPIEPGANEHWQSKSRPQSKYRKCRNYAHENVCNWLIPEDEAETFCVACRLNSVIPDLSSEGNRERWQKLEKAKRRLIYTLLSLKLPIVDFRQNRHRGLAFRFMEDIKGLDPFSEEVVTYEQIMTGHDAGTITINIIEADDSAREKIREKMHESYRTILGHFRHEIGHYYWDQLIAQGEKLEQFRQIFGDERVDYEAALKKYYQQGATTDWYLNYISGYASMHPWEDWAESWAHYLHCVDIMETAGHHEIAFCSESNGKLQMDIHSWLKQIDFNSMIKQLDKLMRTLNELNRSLGLPDPYPFEHSVNTVNKLRFIHDLVMNV